MDAKALLRSITPAQLWSAAIRTRRRLNGGAKRSYSGHGEDLLILSWLKHYNCDVSTIRYVDVGAAHPTELSNTYLLYLHGARGVLIEPDPDQAAILRAKRPRDTVVNAGVAFDDRRSGELFRMSSRVFNTFSQHQAEFVMRSSEHWESRERILDKLMVPLIPLNEIIAKEVPRRPRG